MQEVRNLNNKRVCDISKDLHTIIIVQGGCKTIITTSPDGTLNVKHELIEKTA